MGVFTSVLLFIWSRPKARHIDALFQQFLVPFSHHTACSGANQLTSWWNEPKKKSEHEKNMHITHRTDVLWSVLPKLLFDYSEGTWGKISKKLLEVNRACGQHAPFCKSSCTAQPTAVAGLVQKWLVVPAVGSEWARIMFSPQTKPELQTSRRKSRYACFICFRCTLNWMRQVWKPLKTEIPQIHHEKLQPDVFPASLSMTGPVGVP